MGTKWLVDIVTDTLSEQYEVEAEDSYDAKLVAMERFYSDFDMIVHLSDVDKCVGL